MIGKSHQSPINSIFIYLFIYLFIYYSWLPTYKAGNHKAGILLLEPCLHSSLLWKWSLTLFAQAGFNPWSS
jgi:hypothetical protein